MNRSLATLSLALLTLLAACGGGGDGGTTAPDLGRSTTASSSCPHAQTADVWLNNRLSCAVAGQHVIDMSAGATGLKADVAYVIRQVAYDRAVNDLLPDGKARHFRHFLCVRGVPANVDRQQLAADLEAVMGLAPAVLPSGVSGSTLANAGTSRDGYAAQPCDPARHPIIVNYDAGVVESVNSQALPLLEVYDA